MSEFTVAGLRVVREAVRLGSFSLAADRLGYTQSAVSRQIALMERAAGRALFERQARGVRPTAAGRVVARRADAVLADLHAVRQELDGLGSRAPVRLRVGAFATATAALVPRALAALGEREPQIRVLLREGLSPSLLAAVARGRLDAAVATGPVPEGVEVVHLVDDPLLVAVAAGHPLAGGPAVPPDALRAERWVAGAADTGSTLLGTWPGEWDVAFVARDWTAKLGLVAAGLGVTVVPGLAVPMLPSSVAVVAVDDPAAVRPTVLAHRPGHPCPGFVAALREAVVGLSAEVRRRLDAG